MNATESVLESMENKSIDAKTIALLTDAAVLAAMGRIISRRRITDKTLPSANQKDDAKAKRKAKVAKKSQLRNRRSLAEKRTRAIKRAKGRK